MTWTTTCWRHAAPASPPYGSTGSAHPRPQASLFPCSTTSKRVTRDGHDCVYLGLIDGGSRSEIVSETQTMGPSHLIWLHPPEVVRGYLVESNRSLYSCPSPRPAAASFKQG